MQRTVALVAGCAVLIAGCQSVPPNTQGAGRGATYTPVIDMDGVDHSRYGTDLQACRENAKKVDSNSQAIGGMIAGMLIGAAIGTAVGGNNRFAQDGALFGGAAGVGTAEAKATGTQETIMANCMAGRGYRVLAGATIPTNTYIPSPYTAPAKAQPVTTVLPAPLTAATTPNTKIGQFSFTVERIAKESACNASPVAEMISKGPGYENYSVACSNTDTRLYRCEFGNCRVLQ